MILLLFAFFEFFVIPPSKKEVEPGDNCQKDKNISSVPIRFPEIERHINGQNGNNKINVDRVL